MVGTTSGRHRPRTLIPGIALAYAGILASMLLAGATPVSFAIVDQASCGIHPLDVELIIDRSGSMDSQYSGGQKRIYWAKSAANQLVTALDANGGVGGASGIHHVGLTTFGGVTASVNLSLGSSSASAASSAISAISATGNTPLKLGLATGAADLAANKRTTANDVPVVHVLVMLSDGRPNPDPGQRPSSGEIASYLSAADVAYSIAVGEGGSGSNQIDLTLMQALANPSGNYKHVVEASDLPDLFASIFSELTCPQIGLEKTPSVTTLPADGGEVTYTYEVTNSNPDAPLSNVQVVDDKCSPVTYDTGDANDDGKLQSGETWVFTCSTTLTETTLNTATASGEFNGQSFTVKDDATVEVAEPTPVPTVEPTPVPTVEPTPVPTVEPTPVPTVEPSVEQSTPSPTPEQSVAGATGTPAPSVPDTAIGSAGNGSPVPTIIFGLLLVAAVTGMAWANVAVARSRR